MSPHQHPLPDAHDADAHGDERAQQLRRAASALRPGDAQRLRSLARRIHHRESQGLPVDRMLKQWETELAQAQQRAAGPPLWNPKIEIPAELPISTRREEIVAAIRQHPVLIVCGDTGSGKTTQLPKLAWLAGRGRAGRIGCTQPRRLAASSMARRVAEELRCSPGQQVGFQVRFTNLTTKATVIKFMTDGVLLAETQNDPQLHRYDTLIVDEAHERSLNIDFILGYLKNLLPHRPDLKVILSSATLDADRFSKFFHDAPVISVQGRTYPIEDVYQPPHADDEDLSRQVARAVQWIDELDHEGDILVFLPGEREIHDAAQVLRGRNLARTEILPLYARLSMADQQRVFALGGRRRIVLATNVAETSLTIPGIRYVVDSGLVRLSRYRPRRQIQSLQIEPVSQASARQRRGRCGRVADGVCVRLYAESALLDSPPYTDPEIRRTTLAGVILQMEVLGLPKIEEFPFMDPPSRQLIRQGYQTLFEIGALDADNRLTPVGRELARFPTDPQLARMLAQARDENVLMEGLVIAAALNIQDPRERPLEQAQQADTAHAQWRDDRSDFFTLLRLWNAWHDARHKEHSHNRQRAWCQKHFLNYRRMLEWQNLVAELAEVMRELKWNIKLADRARDDCFHDRVHRAILAGFPMNIGVRDETKQYLGARGHPFHIFPGSGLFKTTPRWVVMFALIETGKLYARMVGAIEPQWVEQAAPHLCRKSHHDIAWSAEQGFVYAKESVKIGELTLLDDRRAHYGRINPEEARRVFIQDGLVPGNLRSPMKWLSDYRRMLQHIALLEQKIRRPHALLNEIALRDHFDRLVPASVCSTSSLDKWLRGRATDEPFAPARDTALAPPGEPIREDDYPDEMEAHGLKFPVQYRYAPGEPSDGMTLMCAADKLAFLPAWAADYVVPGWLPEKLRALIRSLPKDWATQCHPLQKTVDDFLQWLTDHPQWREGPLLTGLAEFLRPRLGAPIKASDFDLARLPEFLMMKLAIVDEHGRTVRFTKEHPAEPVYTSELHEDSTWIPAGWHRTGLTAWDEPSCVEPVPVSGGSPGRVAYPALVDEGASVGLRLFLDETEALTRHRAGLIRLFRLQCADVVERLERQLPVAPMTLRALSALDHGRRSPLDDVVELLLKTMLCDEPPGAPRCPATFHNRAAHVRDHLFERAQEYGVKLDEMFTQRQAVIEAARALNTGPAAEDVARQLSFLFRPGFVRWPELWTRYPRYLQAMIIRLQRALLDPRKDHGKWEPVRVYQQWQDEIVSGLGDEPLPEGLLRYAVLLQEYRVAQFAPELGAIEKVSPQRLQSAWGQFVGRDR